MSLPRHLMFALVYGVIAIAVALTLPYSIPGVGKWTAVAIGALILIFGAVLHETHSRLTLERDLRAELGRLTQARDQVMAELSQARAEMQAIQVQLKSRPGEHAALDRMKDDVRALQEMVSRLTGRPLELRHDGLPMVVDSTARPVISVDALTENELSGLIEDAIRRDRIDMALQPIVSLPQRKTRYYEALCRIRTRSGAHVAASTFIALAERLGRVTAIDNMLLLRCVQLIRDAVRRHRLVGFFANVSIDTLRDDTFMEPFIEFVAECPELPSHLVFEIGAADFRHAGNSLASPMEGLAALGFRFSIDKVEDLEWLDTAGLEERHVGFVKIAAASLLRQVQDPMTDFAAIKRRLDESAIDVIVDRIETESALIELLDLPVDFGQGLLFGEPRTG